MKTGIIILIVIAAIIMVLAGYAACVTSGEADYKNGMDAEAQWENRYRGDD